MIYTGLPSISNYQIEPLPMYFNLSSGEVFAANSVSLLLVVVTGSGPSLPVYMGYIVAYVLRGEFQKFEADVKHQFQPELETPETVKNEFEKLRKRHQKLTVILRQADKFICPAIGACMISMISTTILILYSVCFSIQSNSDFGVKMTYSSFLTVSLTSIALMSGSAIIVNEAVGCYSGDISFSILRFDA